MAAPTGLFLMMYFRERYKRRFYEREGYNTTKRPLPLIIWVFRAIGQIIFPPLFIIIVWYNYKRKKEVESLNQANFK